jgi:hypothetical protein
MGLVVFIVLGIVFVLHGAFGLKGVGHLIEGFNLGKSRQEVLQVSLVAAISFSITMIAWGWGTTLFSREALGLVVGFGPLFLAEVTLYFLAPQFFIRFSRVVAHGVKAGIGIAIPVGTLYYMTYMFYVGH